MALPLSSSALSQRGWPSGCVVRLLLGGAFSASQQAARPGLAGDANALAQPPAAPTPNKTPTKAPTASQPARQPSQQQESDSLFTLGAFSSRWSRLWLASLLVMYAWACASYACGHRDVSPVIVRMVIVGQGSPHLESGFEAGVRHAVEQYCSVKYCVLTSHLWLNLCAEEGVRAFASLSGLQEGGR